jgi:hypothetical protein
MHLKVKTVLLIATSLLGYLEWGQSQSMFLLQGEYEVIKNLFSNPGKAVHPFTIIPMIGQLLLLFSLFQKQPNIYLIRLGIACIALLLGFIFIIGIINFNWKIAVSALPFLIIAIWTFLHTIAINAQNKHRLNAHRHE